MSYYRFLRKQGKPDVQLSIESDFHDMKRDGFCFGCGSAVKRGDTVYRINMLAGKQPYINLCGECQAIIYRDIESNYE